MEWVLLMLLVTVVFLAAGGYAAFTRRGSKVDTHPSSGHGGGDGEVDRSAKTDAGASDETREGPPASHGTR